MRGVVAYAWLDAKTRERLDAADGSSSGSMNKWIATIWRGGR